MSRQALITERITAAFSIEHLEVLNESHNHSAGTESHFKVVLVSPDFNGSRLVARHQKVYATVQDEMSRGLHALALHTYTPDEWAVTQQAPESPACRGGSKHG